MINDGTSNILENSYGIKTNPEFNFRDK